VLTALEHAGVVDRLGAAQERLRRDAGLWQARALLLPHALDLAVGPLRRGGLDPLVFKGPTLAARYPRPALRPMVDIDLILPTGSHDRAVGLLTRAGWSVDHAIDSRRHDTTLVHPDLPSLPLEVHDALDTPRERATRLTADQLWSRRVPVTCFGVETTTLPAEDELVALAVHAAKPYHCFDRLIWLVDLVVAGASAPGGQGLDWQLVVRLADRARCRTIVAVSVILAGQLGLDAPEEARGLPRSPWRRRALAPLFDGQWPLTPPSVRTRRIARFALPDRAATRARLYIGEEPWRHPRELLRDAPRTVRRMATPRRPRTGIATASMVLAAGLRLAPAQAVWRAVDAVSHRLPKRRLELEDPAETAALLGSRIDAVLGSPVIGVRGRCLKRSLILYAMLRRRGLRPRWTVGHLVDAGGGFAVHAWCSLDGVAVAEPPGIADVYRGLLTREPE
jgi:hypothetical protein